MSHITGWGYYWLAWAILGFGIPETIAILRNHLNTLSFQFWGIEHINFAHPLDFADWTPLHFIIGIVLLVFVVWLFVHLTFGVWR